MEYAIIHQPQNERFETTIDGTTAYVKYAKLADGNLRITHTIVPKAIEGCSVAATLVKALLEHAKQNGLTVSSTCSYATVYIKRHPELL